MKSPYLLFLSLLFWISSRSGNAFVLLSPKNKKESWHISSTVLKQSSSATSKEPENIYSVVHRKEYEMKQLNAQHQKSTDPVQMAMGYALESEPPLRLARALRRVYEDEQNPANPNYVEKDTRDETEKRLNDMGFASTGMRRASFIVDIKRKSSMSHPGEMFCDFEDAGMVAEAMVRLGADAVFINVDYGSYGGDFNELRSAVKAVRRVSDTAAIVMKDIVVDEIQLGMAKNAGADAVVLMAAVLGPALEDFLNLATRMGLETIVECHTSSEINAALECMAQNILVSNRDRMTGTFYEDQALKLGWMFPGSGGSIITLATGGIETVEDMKKHVAAGYDGVVVGRSVMGNPRAVEFIKAVRERSHLPAELAHWNKDGVEFDLDGNAIPETVPKKNMPGYYASDCPRPIEEDGNTEDYNDKSGGGGDGGLDGMAP